MIFLIRKDVDKVNSVTQNFLCGREKHHRVPDFVRGVVSWLYFRVTQRWEWNWGLGLDYDYDEEGVNLQLYNY